MVTLGSGIEAEGQWFLVAAAAIMRRAALAITAWRVGELFGFVVRGRGAEARLDEGAVVCWAARRLGEWFGGSLPCDGGDDGDVVARLQRAMVFGIGTGGGVAALLTPGYGL